MARMLLVALLLAATAASARMYEWRNPRTGSVQYAGVPPAWYRSPEGGPRVRVYDGGTLIDDTAIELTADESRQMREEAFAALEQRQQLDAIKRLERAARREAARQEEARRQQAREQGRALPEDAQAAAPEDSEQLLDPATVDRLKAIISAYDRAAGAPGAQRQELPAGSQEIEPEAPAVRY
ncbi:MAG: hypothetical protein R3286_04670 [Gammaproteobacteria bacterium]|nr:hypothetical protein [Gammaproteobacteria bacterium]